MNTSLFMSALREADKSRFIKPAYENFVKQRNEELSDSQFTPRQLPSVDDIIKYVNSGAADSHHFDWSKIKNNNIVEFMRLINCFEDYIEKGGSRKNRKAARQHFSDTNLFVLHQVENENWLFVSPRTYEACVYMDSAECGGQSAKWCIGYNQDDSYYQQYVKSGSKFILALKKPSAPKHINGLDYDEYPTPAYKYMLEITPEHTIVGWRPCDDENNTLNMIDCEKLFGLSRDEIFSMVENWNEIVLDVPDIVITFERLMAGAWYGEDDLTVVMPHEIDSVDLGKIFEMYGSYNHTLTLSNGLVQNLVVSDNLEKQDLEIDVHEMMIGNAYFHRTQSEICFSDSTIRQAYFTGVNELAEEEMANDDEGETSFEDWLETAYYLLYDNDGTLSFYHSDVLKRIYL